MSSLDRKQQVVLQTKKQLWERIQNKVIKSGLHRAGKHHCSSQFRNSTGHMLPFVLTPGPENVPGLAMGFCSMWVVFHGSWLFPLDSWLSLLSRPSFPVRNTMWQCSLSSQNSEGRDRRITAMQKPAWSACECQPELPGKTLSQNQSPKPNQADQTKCPVCLVEKLSQPVPCLEGV